MKMRSIALIGALAASTGLSSCAAMMTTQRQQFDQPCSLYLARTAYQQCQQERQLRQESKRELDNTNRQQKYDQRQST